MFMSITSRLTTCSSLLLLAVVTGCGSMKNHHATEQLLVSDAVDRSVEQIDFRALTGHRVYLDARYMRQVRGVGFVNADYIISSLRQKAVEAGCILEEELEQAEYVVELRVGALGTDGHETNYGIPGTGAINSTASLVGGSALIPPLPEISFARRDERRAAAKIAVFAYNRATKQAVTAPITAHGHSLARATWVLGAGPFQEGSIYESSEIGNTIPPLDASLVRDNPVVRLLQPVEEMSQPPAALDEPGTPEPGRPSTGRPTLTSWFD